MKEEEEGGRWGGGVGGEEQHMTAALQLQCGLLVDEMLRSYAEFQPRELRNRPRCCKLKGADAKPMTYVLMRSFSHASYGIGHVLCPALPLMCHDEGAWPIL